MIWDFKLRFAELILLAISMGTATFAVAAEDPIRKRQWHLDELRVEEAWRELPHRAKAITIAIIDGGINSRNPDLEGALDDNGWDFIKDEPIGPDSQEPNGHGTFVAGLIGARPHNGIGGMGVCPMCRLMILRFLDKDGQGSSDDGAAAIRLAVDRGARVINLSFAAEGKHDGLEAALKYADDHDVLVIAAAGNQGVNLDADDEEIYPPKYRFANKLTITSSDKDREFVDGVNWGRKFVDLAAPGDDIWGPWLNEWESTSGTSFAAPIAAGVAGLVLTANPELSAKQVKDILLHSATYSRGLKSRTRSSGVINALRAVKTAKHHY